MKELNYKTCDKCGGKMLPQTMSQVFKVGGKEIEIRGIKIFRCENCGEQVYDAKEMRMIDKLIHAMDDKPAVDILNLEETAEYLRVSNWGGFINKKVFFIRFTKNFELVKLDFE